MRGLLFVRCTMGSSNNQRALWPQGSLQSVIPDLFLGYCLAHTVEQTLLLVTSLIPCVCDAGFVFGSQE